MQRMTARPASTMFRLSLTVWVTLAAAAPASAQFYSSSGANSTSPVNLFPVDPARQVLDLGANSLLVGNSGVGSFSAMAGASLNAAGLSVGNGGTGSGTVTVTGARTQATLGGTGNRLEIGNWGSGSLTVSNGALVDATVNAAACRAAGAFCNSFVGNAAGSTGTLTITGAGSEVRTLRNFGVGSTGVYTQARDGFNFGTPGGTTNAFVNVLNGGTLRTQQANVGLGPNTASALGTERGFGTVVVDGTGSLWAIGPNSIDNAAAGLVVGNRAGGDGTIDVRNGGKLIIDGSNGSGPNDFLNIGVNGGRGSVTVSGIGSSIDVSGFGAIIQAGRSGAGASGSFSVLAGATASSLYFNVGRELASGTVLISGAGSTLDLVGVGSAGNGGAGMLVGSTGGSGQVTVSNGGRIFIGDGGGDGRQQSNSQGMTLGRENGSNGTLIVTGAGSVVQMNSTSLAPGVGVADNFNPGLLLGRDAGSSGNLAITNGGKVLIDGGALSTVANPRTTAVNIGGSSDVSRGGTGTALVSGRGSELRVTGNDAFIGVGRGTGTVGQLTVADGAAVTATNMNVGRGGGSGTLVVDGAFLTMTGQQTGNNLSGSSLSIGNLGGTGVATITNGSRVDIVNPGSAGASLNLGGTGPNPLGNGTLTVAGASQVNITAAAGLATFSIGRDGTGSAIIKEGSTVNVGDGSTFIGRLAGSSGRLTVDGVSSTLNSGYVGVGRTTAGNGGSGQLIVSNGGTVRADTIEIGSAGFVGGNGGTLDGNVILHGTLSPGESPGSIIINRSLRTGSGHLILDVDSNGAGGYITDHLIFTLGTTFSFTGLEVTFNFLNNADPYSFAASGGFDLDTFLLSLNTATGITTGLSDVFAPGDTYGSLFATATFNAVSQGTPISGLEVLPDGTVTFTTAVPEPETWALMVLGFGAMGLAARRRKALCHAG